MMFYKNTKAMDHLYYANTDFFKIVTGSQGDTIGPFCL